MSKQMKNNLALELIPHLEVQCAGDKPGDEPYILIRLSWLKKSWFGCINYIDYFNGGSKIAINFHDKTLLEDIVHYVYDCLYIRRSQEIRSDDVEYTLVTNCGTRPESIKHSEKMKPSLERILGYIRSIATLSPP